MNKNEIRPPRLQAQRSRSGLGWLLVVIVLIVGGTATVYAYTKNKTHAIGRKQAALEREIAGLEEEMRELNNQIKEALSSTNLTERLATRRTKLRDINPESIVTIPAADKR